jgi:hypothetical protein
MFSDFNSFCAKLEHMNKSFQILENKRTQADGIAPAIKEIVKTAFDLTVDGFELTSRLSSYGFPEADMERRDVRELNKVANYWRICRSLEGYCRSRLLRQYFRRLELQVLQHFLPWVVDGTSDTRYVHAEIQLLVYHELLGNEDSPRAIGASKAACFLCEAFVRAHGGFSTSKSHGIVFSQWTVPDLKEFSNASLLRFRKAIKRIDKDVRQEYFRMENTKSRKEDPLQSYTNLQRPSPLSPAASNSVYSAQSGSIVTTIPRGLSVNQGFANKEEQQVNMILVVPHHPSCAISARRNKDKEAVDLGDSSITPRAIALNMRQALTIPPLEENFSLVSEIPVYVDMEWLQISISLGPASASELNEFLQKDDSTEQRAYRRGGIRLSSATKDEVYRLPHIDVDRLTAHERVTISTKDGMSGSEIAFIVTQGPKSPILLQCQWYSREE